MPAAAVIPAPIAYIKVVAVKKLVVGGSRGDGPGASRDQSGGRGGRVSECIHTPPACYCEESRVLKAGVRGLDMLAWNNGGRGS